MFPSFRFHLSWISVSRRTPRWPQLQLLGTKWVKKLPPNPILRCSTQLLGACRPHCQPPAAPAVHLLASVLARGAGLRSPGCPLPWPSSIGPWTASLLAPGEGTSGCKGTASTRPPLSQGSSFQQHGTSPDPLLGLGLTLRASDTPPGYTSKPFTAVFSPL